MNKKTRLISGVLIIIVLLGYLVFSSGVTANQYEVSAAVAAREQLEGKVIIVNGTLVQGSEQWDGLNRKLTFKMTDGAATMDVVFTGDKPDIPTENVQIQTVVTGQFNNSRFDAFRMLTKCPSKYESGGTVYATPTANGRK